MRKWPSHLYSGVLCVCVCFHFLLSVHMSEITESHAIWYIYPKPKKIYCWYQITDVELKIRYIIFICAVFGVLSVHNHRQLRVRGRTVPITGFEAPNLKYVDHSALKKGRKKKPRSRRLCIQVWHPQSFQVL